jgi:hypothetical protein
MTAIKALADSLRKLEIGMAELKELTFNVQCNPPPLAAADHRGEYIISSTGAKHEHVFMILHSKGIKKCYDCSYEQKIRQ